MSKLLKLMPVFILTMIGLAFALPNSAYATTAGFQAGEIMDDGVMTNARSMSASQIQAFLNSKVPTCDTNGTQPSEFGGGTRAQWAAARGYYPPFTCLKDYTENGLSSAQIIYNVAQKYTINPQSLIVLLQKEQGLVTDTWPLSSQYKTATGYGCPDTAPCDSQYYGLTNQLDWAAKMYRSILNQDPNWYSPYFKGSNPRVYWNPNTSVCGSAPLDILNWTTAGLYSYTPYRPNQAALNAGYGMGDSCSSYGNRNFYSYFTDWFGSTLFPQPTGMSLDQEISTGAIYLVDSSGSTPIKYQVPDWPTMQNYGLDNYPVVPVPSSALQGMTNGGFLTSLVWDGNSVYLVNNQTRYAVTGDMCTKWGLSCMDGNQVKSLNSAFQTQYLKQGPLLPSLMSYGGVTYQMSAGQRQPIANEKSLSDLGLSNISPIAVSSVNANQPLGALLMTTPGIVKFAPNQTLYYFNGTNYFTIPSMDIYYALGLNRLSSLWIPTSSYNSAAPSSTTLTYWATDTSNNRYVLNNGNKIPLSAAKQAYWPSAAYVTGLDSLLSMLPSDTLNSFIKSGAAYYQLNQSDGKKHYITSMADYTDLGGNSSNTTYLAGPIADAIPTGLFAFPDGSLLKVGSDPALYVMNENQLLYVPSMDVLYAYNFNTSRLIVYPDAVQYTKGSAIDYGQLPDGTITLVGNRQLLTLSPAQATSYGFKQTNTPTTISQQFIRNASKTQVTNFLRNSDDGSIYYASNGALHHVDSMDTYRSLGGSTAPPSPVNSRIIGLFTIGSDV